MKGGLGRGQGHREEGLGPVADPVARLCRAGNLALVAEVRLGRAAHGRVGLRSEDLAVDLPGDPRMSRRSRQAQPLYCRANRQRGGAADP